MGGSLATQLLGLTSAGPDAATLGLLAASMFALGLGVGGALLAAARPASDNFEDGLPTDPQTGFGNRLALDAAIDHRRWAGSRRTAVVTFDVDIDGAPVDERLMAATADTIARNIRGNDVPFRVDETRFSVILDNASTEAARAVAERVRRDVAAAALAYSPTAIVSAGVASGPAHTARALIDIAESVRYEAHAAGGHLVGTS